MTKKDYELIALWLHDYTIVTIITPEDGDQYEERHFTRGAIPALVARLGKDNPRFSETLFEEIVVDGK